MTASSFPFCGSCGADVLNFEMNPTDKHCDACGADLTLHGFGGLVPPNDVAAAGGSLQVVFSFTANPDADTMTLTYTIDGGDEVVLEDQTSPVTVVAAEGEQVCAVVAAVKDGITGPTSTVVCDVATA